MKKMIVVVVVALFSFGAYFMLSTKQAESVYDMMPQDNAGGMIPQDSTDGMIYPITVNGKTLNNKSMLVSEGLIGFPAKEIAEILGYDVREDADKLMIDEAISIDKESGYINGEEPDYDTIVIFYNNECYVSGYALANMLDFDYLIENDSVEIKK